MYRFPFPEFPNGWFQIANRSEFDAGSTIERSYFGKRLSLSVDGQDRVDLNVEGPSGQAEQTWPIAERWGLFFVHHHASGCPPSWELPSLAIFDEPGWTKMQTTCLEIRSHPQEICENTADVAHLASVHGMRVADRSSIVVEEEGPLLRIGVGLEIASRPDSAEANVPIQMWTENYGPALGVVHLANPGGTETFSTYAPTPRGDGLVDYWISTALRRKGSVEETRRALEHSHRYQCATVLEDVPIWENKMFRERPRLSDADGPIERFRRWYGQYY